MTQTPPLAVANLLAPTPQHGPKYATSVRKKDGTTIQVADPDITRVLISLMDMNAVLGGAASHFGGPSAFAELMSALYSLVFDESLRTKRPWHDLFHLINDAGHCENGIYALKANYGFADLTFSKLKHFRSIQSVLTGHGESHLFPQGVFLSNGPLGSSLPQAQGLAMADALAGRDRVTVVTISDGACMEGEAREALAAIPGLAARGKMAPFVLIISDNNTKLSGRIDQESFSMEPTFASLVSQGWIVLEVKDGHNLQSCANAIEEAIALSKDRGPVAIHAKTIKGMGVRKTMESASGGHGFPLKAASELRAFVQEILQGRELPAELEAWLKELETTPVKKSGSTGVKTEKIQVGISQALIKARSGGLPVVSITSDLPGSTGVAEFRKQFPEASIDVGVAESNMVSVAAGFSKLGFIPVVDTFAQFGVTKGALPLMMSSLSDAPVIAIFSHTGFQDAADGASHQSLSYFAMTAAIPHADVYALTCSEEAQALLGQTIEAFAKARSKGQTPRTSVFFLGRENFPSHYGTNHYELGRAQILADTATSDKPSVTLVVGGSLVPMALKAQAALASEGIGALVVNPSRINHPDVETIGAALKRTHGNLITVEDHQIIGGMGAQIVHALKMAGHNFQLMSLGVKDQFGQSAYEADELYHKHGLDAEAIAQATRKLLSTTKSNQY